MLGREYNDAGGSIFDSDEVDKEQVEGAISKLDKDQMMLILIADKKACVEGNLLCIGINHRGQMLPGRIRCMARDASLMDFNWEDGQPLSENFQSDELEDEHHYSYNVTGEGTDGWA